MMKTLKTAFAFTLLLFLSLGLQAQKKVESEAATLKFSLSDGDAIQVGGKTMFQIEVTPKAGWHVYSAIPSEDGAYQPAVLGWDITSRGFESGAKIEEKGGLIEAFDEIMNGTVRYYKGQVVFSQEIKLTETEVILEGYFDYMACNDEKCIPLTAEVKFEATAKE
jgi:DsbC/DsbD-like thiol-disulfide interchange protein